jgi:hypothetical protein
LIVPPINLLLLQLLVVVVAIALRHPLTAVPIFAVTLLPSFFFLQRPRTSRISARRQGQQTSQFGHRHHPGRRHGGGRALSTCRSWVGELTLPDSALRFGKARTINNR